MKGEDENLQEVFQQDDGMSLFVFWGKMSQVDIWHRDCSRKKLVAKRLNVVNHCNIPGKRRWRPETRHWQ